MLIQTDNLDSQLINTIDLKFRTFWISNIYFLVDFKLSRIVVRSVKLHHLSKCSLFNKNSLIVLLLLFLILTLYLGTWSWSCHEEWNHWSPDSRKKRRRVSEPTLEWNNAQPKKADCRVAQTHRLDTCRIGQLYNTRNFTCTVRVTRAKKIFLHKIKCLKNSQTYCHVWIERIAYYLWSKESIWFFPTTFCYECFCFMTFYFIRLIGFCDDIFLLQKR